MPAVPIFSPENMWCVNSKHIYIYGVTYICDKHVTNNMLQLILKYIERHLTATR